MNNIEATRQEKLPKPIDPTSQSLIELLLSFPSEELSKNTVFTRHPTSIANNFCDPSVAKQFPLVLPDPYKNLNTYYDDPRIDVKVKQYMWDTCLSEYYLDTVWESNNWVWVSPRWYECAYEQSLAYRSAARSDYRLIPNSIVVSNARRARTKLKIIFEVCDELGIWYIANSGQKNITKDILLDPDYRQNTTIYIDGHRVDVLFTDLIAERRQADPKMLNAVYRWVDPEYIQYNKKDIPLIQKRLNRLTNKRWDSETLHELFHRVSYFDRCVKLLPEMMEAMDSRKRVLSKDRFQVDRLRVSAIWHHQHMIAYKAYLINRMRGWSMDALFLQLDSHRKPKNSSSSVITYDVNNDVEILTNNFFSVTSQSTDQ